MAVPHPFESCVSKPLRRPAASTVVAPHAACWEWQITEVCQKKGCWTVIRQGDEHVRVRFKDYGFFLPKDCVGAKAYAQGSVSVEVGFTATGVRLVRSD